MRKTARHGIWVAGRSLAGLAGVLPWRLGWWLSDGVARPHAASSERPPHHDRHAAGRCAWARTATPRLRRRGSTAWPPAASASPTPAPTTSSPCRRTPTSSTGRLPPDHGVRDNAGFRLPRPRRRSLRGSRPSRFRTGAFISAFPLDSRFGLARGFDVYDDAFVDAAPRPAFLEQERAGADTVAAAIALAAIADAGSRTARRRGSAGCTSTSRTFPYAPPAPFADRFRSDAYAGEVAAADAALGPLLQPILDAGAATDTLVVLTSDHGEALGDHGEATHGIFAYEATLKVPLDCLLRRRSSRRASSLRAAGHVDILPTILDALGLPAAPGLRGRSLLGPSHAARTLRRSPTSRRCRDRSIAAGRRCRALSRTASNTSICRSRSSTTFATDPRRSAQPGRRSDRSRSRRTAHCSASVADPRSSGAPTRPPRSESGCERWDTSRRVRPARRRHYTDADDPKRLIGRRSRAAGDRPALRWTARWPDGARACACARQPSTRHAGRPAAARASRARGRETAGGDRRAAARVTLDPGDAETASLLGAYLTADARPREAADAASAVCGRGRRGRAGPVAAGAGRGTARAAPDDARHVLEKARAQDPVERDVPSRDGTVELMAGRRAQARAAFEAALALNPDDCARAQLAWRAGRGGRSTSTSRCDTGAARSRSIRPSSRSCWQSASRSRGTDGSPRLVATRTLRRRAPPARYAADIARAREWLEPGTAVRWPSCACASPRVACLRQSRFRAVRRGPPAQTPDALAGARTSLAAAEAEPSRRRATTRREPLS